MSREIRYWRERGIRDGPERYPRYLALFGLGPDSLSGSSVADFGCGPFGGVLSTLARLAAAYPLDALSATYNGWGLSAIPILPVDPETCRTDLPDGICDAVFCLNALDHLREAHRMVEEIQRVLRADGRLYLFVHLRDASKGHRGISERYVDGLIQWHWEYREIGPDTPNQEPGLTALWGIVRKTTNEP